MSVFPSSPIRTLALAALCGVSLGVFSRAKADSVTSITTTTTNYPASTTSGSAGKTLDWEGHSTTINSSFTSSSGATYTSSSIFGSLSISFDAASANLASKSRVYDLLDSVNTTTNTYNFVGSMPSGSLGSVMTSSNLTTAVANPFSNGNNAANIERIDVYFGTSYTYTSTSAADAIVIYCLTTSASASFKVLAFQDSDASVNKVTSYTGTTVTATTSGATLATGTYSLLTYSGTDSLSGMPSVSSETTTLYLVGVVIKLSDLGLSPGTTINGISLFASDVDTSSYSNLLDVTSSAYSNSTTSNVSFLGFGGVTETNVPEASTYGLIFSGLGVASYGFMRLRRRSASAVK